MQSRVDAEPDVALGEALAEPFDDVRSGVILLLKAKNQLDFSTIVLLAERSEICLELWLGVIKRLENRDGPVTRVARDAFLGKFREKPCRNQGVEAA